jgi:cytochrome c-type biogenesis protein CcmH/NrfG
MNGLMSASRTQLLSRKRDLFAAMRTLQRDYEDGLIDEDAYRSAVGRYEAEAAGILERLDAMHPDHDQRIERPPTSRPSLSRVFAAGTAVLALIAIALFLVAATHHRSGNEAVTGSGGAPAASTPLPVPVAVTAALRSVRLHPRSVPALLDLGNAYFDSGDVASAERSYSAAMKLAPDAPEPRVLQAMAVGMGGNPTGAGALLRGIQRTHPTYARAWLLDGLFTAHTKRGYARSIRDWRRFLALDPSSSMTPRVRQWLATAKRQEKAAKR